MFEKDAPAEPPEIPPVVAGDAFRGQPHGLEQGKRAQNEDRPEQGAPLPAAAAQQDPEAERPRDGERPAAAGSPLGQEDPGPSRRQNAASASGTRSFRRRMNQTPKAGMSARAI